VFEIAAASWPPDGRPSSFIVALRCLGPARFSRDMTRARRRDRPAPDDVVSPGGQLRRELVANVVDDYRSSRVVRHLRADRAAPVQPGRVVTAAAMAASLSGLYQTGV
jgi:hypothetical protein